MTPEKTMSADIAAPAARRLHPLLERLVSIVPATVLEPAGFDAWAGAPGAALLVFTEDPVIHRETLDLAVIVPELAAAMPGRFRTGLLLPAAARALAPRYGFRRWPALVLLKDGRYVGAIDGLRDWQVFIEQLSALLDAEPTRPPSIGIAVTAESERPGHGCH
jgi:hydrogenase-1 operon protein HyaE